MTVHCWSLIQDPNHRPIGRRAFNSSPQLEENYDLREIAPLTGTVTEKGEDLITSERASIFLPFNFHVKHESMCMFSKRVWAPKCRRLAALACQPTNTPHSHESIAIESTTAAP